ncbi:hypothetical protein X765_04430 [Mesorhizobium sp. LSHC440B00]|nr:hypothetical protein X765_04430 [Mesorhizobium sp. LSHC440B00]
MMKQVFLAFTVVLAVLAGMEAPAKAEPTVTYALDNGLQVVLVPDHRVPKVVMNLRYRVGSMNEPAGRSGFAHLFEHLMFSGTPAWPNVFGAHAALGNEINAWTTEDGTVYYVDGLSSSLPMILSLEADRMANLGRSVTQAKLDLQRSVVKNEMRQNVLDKAGASGWEAFWSGLFPKPHPYSRMVIGSVADLDAGSSWCSRIVYQAPSSWSASVARWRSRPTMVRSALPPNCSATANMDFCATGWFRSWALPPMPARAGPAVCSVAALPSRRVPPKVWRRKRWKAR